LERGKTTAEIGKTIKYEHNNEGYLVKMFDILKQYSANPMEDQLKRWDFAT